MSGVCQFKPIIPYLIGRKAKAYTEILADRGSAALLIRPGIAQHWIHLARNVSDEPQDVKEIGFAGGIVADQKRSGPQWHIHILKNFPVLEPDSCHAYRLCNIFNMFQLLSKT